MDAGPMLRRVKLMNPFEIVQDRVSQDRISQDRITQDRPQPIERKVVNRAARATPVCAACGSDDIICHATAQWSNEAQGGSSLIPSTSQRTATPATTTAIWCG